MNTLGPVTLLTGFEEDFDLCKQFRIPNVPIRLTLIPGCLAGPKAIEPTPGDLKEPTYELRPRFRTNSLLTLCCHFPSHIFKSLYRCLVAAAGMPTLPVVGNLDVFKDSNLGLRARFKALAVHQFFFQRSKEALRRRVI